MRVLVVDDDQAAVSGLRKLLALDGYEVTALSSARIALDLVVKERFDAVVTDLEMPEVNGVEIVRAARAGGSNVPVLVVTGYVTSPAAKNALALGAYCIIDKPLDYDSLASELKAALAS